MTSHHSHIDKNGMHGKRLLKPGMHASLLASWTWGMQRHATCNPTPEQQFKHNHEGLISGQGLTACHRAEEVFCNHKTEKRMLQLDTSMMTND